MKFALFCLFIGLPIACGEWDGSILGADDDGAELLPALSESLF